MNEATKIIIYILVMAMITYLLRSVPFVFFRKKITNPFLLDVLYYMPYGILTAMTIPAIFNSGVSPIAVIFALAVSIVLSLLEKSMVAVAIACASAALVTEIIIKLITNNSI